ncbi:MAG: hypothetical protein ACOVMR_09810 [Flavobacteriales bacterium]
MTIITDAPSWLILACILMGAVYAGALYFRDRFNRTYGSRLAGLLAAMRFGVVTLIAFFLLKPLIKTIQREVEKPIIIIAQDNSQSLSLVKDSAMYKTTYLDQLKSLKDALGEDYDVRSYSFGDQIREGLDSISLQEKETNFSGLLEEINTKFAGRNLGALIIGSDGIYNKGSNPIYAYNKLNAPVYTVALGDTTVRKDALIAEVAANRLAYLNNKFPISVSVEGRKCAGETVQLTVSHKGNTVFSQPVTFDGNRSSKTIDLTQDAKTVGLQKYTVTISNLNGEITYANNRKDVFIEVLDSRQKVLILASSPHPDVNAMREAIASNDAYSISTELVSKFNGNINDYNLIIFHQLPSSGSQGLNLVKNAIDQNIPSLFIWGANTDFNAFNALGLGYALSGYRNTNTDINAAVMEGYSLFQIEKITSDLIATAPPLSVPFGDFEVSPGANIFVRQQVGQISTSKPLIAFNKKNENKIGLIAGEGIWRWRINAFRQFETHDVFNGMVSKMVQYLASKEDKSLFRVNGPTDFPENIAISFDAELYNASYEAVIDKEISMVIKNEEGREFPYTFSPLNGRYKLNAGSLPVGNYTYVASTVSEGQTLKEIGEFSVSPLQAELTNTIADHKLLAQFARENGGEMVYPDAVSSLVEKIKAREEITSVSYETKQLNDLINFRWLLFLILLLLGGEWLLRKRAGTY